MERHRTRNENGARCATATSRVSVGMSRPSELTPTRWTRPQWPGKKAGGLLLEHIRALFCASYAVRVLHQCIPAKMAMKRISKVCRKARMHGTWLTGDRSWRTSAATRPARAVLARPATTCSRCVVARVTETAVADILYSGRLRSWVPYVVERSALQRGKALLTCAVRFALRRWRLLPQHNLPDGLPL